MSHEGTPFDGMTDETLKAWRDNEDQLARAARRMTNQVPDDSLVHRALLANAARHERQRVLVDSELHRRRPA